MQKKIIVSGAFDDIKSGDLRFLEQASNLGELTVLLWPDSVIEKFSGRPSQFPLAERAYFLNAVRYVSRVVVAEGGGDFNSLPGNLSAQVWADRAPGRVGDEGIHDASARERFCRRQDILYHVISSHQPESFPEPAPMPSPPGSKKVVVTGCYDWVHSGHVRFFEEASAYGDLYVCLGNDANVLALKGEGHPLLKEAERRYVVGSIKYVKQSIINTGSGWLDADPEIRRLKPDFYIVNEDGDKGGKREYCQDLGIQYIVLNRLPAPGLPKRTSTKLRGF